MRRQNDNLMIETPDGEEFEIPTKYEVCGRCGGTGVHDHPAFSDGITADDFAEDPDFREDYYRGHYDVTCEQCGGLRVELVPDYESMTTEQIRMVESHFGAIADMEAEYEAERRMGA